MSLLYLLGSNFQGALISETRLAGTRTQPSNIAMNHGNADEGFFGGSRMFV